MNFYTGATQDLDDFLLFLRSLSPEQQLNLAVARGIQWRPQRKGNTDANLQLLASQLASPHTVAGALRTLSRRQLSLLRLLLRNAHEISQRGMARYFAPVLDRATLSSELEHLKQLALLLPTASEGQFFVPDGVKIAFLGRVAQPRSAAQLLQGTRFDALQRVCAELGLPSPASTKSAIETLQATLADERAVRARLAGLDTPERKVLDLIALFGGQIDPWTLSQRLPGSVAHGKQNGFVLSLGQAAGQQPEPSAPTLSLQRKALLMAYPGNWPTQFAIPDEVLAALQPEARLVPEDFEEPALVRPPASARPAGTQPAPVLDLVECLRYVADSGPSLTQKALVPKPDSKKLARRLSPADSDYADLLFSLASALDLVVLNGFTMACSPHFEEWLDLNEADQRTDLVDAWQALVNWIDSEPEPYPRTQGIEQPLPRRASVVELVKELPPEGATLDSLAARLRYRRPGLFDPGLLGLSLLVPPSNAGAWDPRGVLRVLSWLGLAEPLVQPGTPGREPEAVAMRLTTSGRAVLQSDETARAAAAVPRTDRIIVQPTLDVLAPPNIEPRLYFRLRGLAEPGASSGMRSLLLTPASVRRALDSGDTPAGLRALLAEHSDTPLPNTVEQLFADVAAKHGRIRVGSAGYYLTVDDPRLLEELQANRGTAQLIQRVLAPTVALVQAASLERLLDALRSAGHMPIAEREHGTTRPGSVLRIVGDPGTGTAQTAPIAITSGRTFTDYDAITAVLSEAMARQVQAEILYPTRTFGVETMETHRIEVLSMDGRKAYAYDHFSMKERQFQLERIAEAKLTRKGTLFSVRYPGRQY